MPRRDSMALFFSSRDVFTIGYASSVLSASGNGIFRSRATALRYTLSPVASVSPSFLKTSSASPSYRNPFPAARSTVRAASSRITGNRMYSAFSPYLRTSLRTSCTSVSASFSSSDIHSDFPASRT